jgi:thioredoxin reductase (NADPH)
MANKPVIIVADNESGSDDLGTVLGNRFAHDYQIVADRLEACGAVLEQCKATGAAVALVIATQRTDDPREAAFLSRARELHPKAKRLLVCPMARATPAVVIGPMSDGRAHDYLVTPWGHPEETLYPQVTELLSAWVKTQDHARVEALRIIGEQWSARAHRLRDQLERNNIAYGFYEAASEQGRQFLAQAGQDGSRLPVVVVWDGRVFVDPSMEDLAHAGGTRTQPDPGLYDVTVVGAGPAGLAACVYAASEGLRTLLIECEAQGGQAGTSSMIRNYAGFPRGISGRELARRATEQAWLLGTTPVYNRVTGLRADGAHRVVSLADGTEAPSRAVVLATGISYRRLDVPGLDRLTGAGVFYGASMAEAKAMTGLDVYMVGAGNSAGQAAVHFAQYARQVTMLMRGDSLARGMSDYLIKDIAATPNIVVRPGTQVSAVHGEHRVEGLTLTGPDGPIDVPAAALFVLIGAQPLTDWLPETVLRDRSGYLVTGHDLLTDGGPPSCWPLRRLPLPMETSMPGVFAAGDVRHRSTKRVASAVGSGAIAIQFVHEYLAEMG